MSDVDDQQPSEYTKIKPPHRYWNATEPFFDFKASHWVEIALTVALLGVGGSQLYVYWRQAGIMKEQANISARQLDLMQIDERPWVTLQSTELRSSLTFKDGNANLWLGYKLKNLGHSPAFDASFYAVAVPVWINKAVGVIQPHLVPDPTLAVLDADRATKRMCEGAFEIAKLKEEKKNLTEQSQGMHVGYTFLSFGTTIFPDGTIEDVSDSVSESFSPPTTSDPKAIAESYILLITACVRYTDPQSNKIHYTTRAYQLLGIAPNDPKKSVYTLRMGTQEIPMDSLSLSAGEAQYAD